MRGNHKKLTLLTIIIIITAFLLSATPAAVASPLPYIDASYAAIVFHTWVTAPYGFTNGVPNYSQSPYYAWSQGTDAGPATFTFRASGTGSASGTLHQLYYLNPNETTTTPSSGEVTWSFSFTYTVVPPLGAITLNVTSGTFHYQITAGPFKSPTVYTYTTPVAFTGTISSDGSLIVTTPSPPGPWSFTPDLVPSVTPQQIFVGHTVMIRQ